MRIHWVGYLISCRYCLLLDTLRLIIYIFLYLIYQRIISSLICMYVYYLILNWFVRCFMNVFIRINKKLMCIENQIDKLLSLLYNFCLNRQVGTVMFMFVTTTDLYQTDQYYYQNTCKTTVLNQHFFRSFRIHCSYTHSYK